MVSDVVCGVTSLFFSSALSVFPLCLHRRARKGDTGAIASGVAGTWEDRSVEPLGCELAVAGLWLPMRR